MSLVNSMRVLRSNHELPRWSGRWVLTPRKPLEEPLRSQVVARRRRTFYGLVAGTCLTLPAGLVLGLGLLAWAGTLQAAALAGFVGFLLSDKKKQAARPLHLPELAPTLYLVRDGAPAAREEIVHERRRALSGWTGHPAGWEFEQRRA
jgi:hypothetical protein